MKSAFILVLAAATLQPATDPRAAAEATAGLDLARAEKYEQAIAHYRAALKLDPAIPGLELNLGLAYFKLNRFQEAIHPFEQAVKADPSSFQARALLGISYYGTRRFAEAAAQLKPAAAAQPDNTELRFKLAQCYLWSRQYEAAKKRVPVSVAQGSGLRTGSHASRGGAGCGEPEGAGDSGIRGGGESRAA